MKRIPDDVNNTKRLGGLYGQLFERYVLRVLEDAFPGKVRKISESDFPGNADCLVYFPGKVLVIEIKSEHFVAIQHYRLMDIKERRLEIENAGVRKGRIPIYSPIPRRLEL